jgi:Leucine-rich repeat (LRR) protein
MSEDLSAVWNSNVGIDALCEANGVSREEFLQGRCSEIAALELFLLVVPKCPPLQYFPNLTSLRLMHLGLQRIEYLQHLPHLQLLWLQENDIAKIEGLDGCTQLQELYLNSNLIKKIEGLDKLVNLRVLWLQSNEIEVVEGLDALKDLRSLHLAANKITSLGAAVVASLPRLEELNVAANRLSSFREVLPLASLTKLERLWFSDSVYGSNPLCNLCNYHTFTLFLLRRLKQLDYQQIGADQRTMAESTFIKKKIYYNMRVKTLKRNARAMMRKAEQYHAAKTAELVMSQSMLRRAIFELEAETALQTNGRAGDGAVPDKQLIAEYRKRKATLQIALDRREETFGRLVALLDSVKERLAQQTNSSIRRLVLELHTGGNVRLEEGKPKDVWYQSCSELLRTRFFPADFEAYGVKELRVTRVTKIYNRTVRGHFDAALEELVDVSDPAYKRALEYLFIVEQPGVLSEDAFFRLVEFGIGTDGGVNLAPDGSVAANAPPLVAVTNSAFFVEHARLQAALKRGDLTRNTNALDNPALTGRIIVAKAFVGRCVPESPPFVPPTGDVPLASVGVNRAGYAPEVTSVYRTKPGDGKQRLWFMLDPRLVLPEYVLEYSLQVSGVPKPALTSPVTAGGDWTEAARAADANELVARAFPRASSVDAADLRGLAPLFLSYAQSAAHLLASSGNKDDAAQLVAAEPQPPRRTLEGSDGTTPEELVAYLGGAVDLAGLETLSVIGTGLRVFSAATLTALAGKLTKLVAPFNDIQSLDFLGSLPHLTHLDVSNNVIRKCEGLAMGNVTLTTLKLAGNLLYRVEDAHALVACCAHVEVLTIAGNPVADAQPFVDAIVLGLPKLKDFDALGLGTTVADVKANLLQRPECLDTTIAAAALAHATVDPIRRRVEIHEAPVVAKDGYPPLAKGTAVASNHELDQAASLTVRGQRLSRATCLQQLPELQVLDLGCNNFASLEPLLPASRTVESLTLDGNRLFRLDDLAAFTLLRRLELANNHLTKLDGVQALEQLAFLSVEDNAVTSLAPLSGLSALSELYASNNRIESQKELLHLRGLPRLIIADFSGNTCCDEEQYRLYAVFQLKKLKVLDGASIDTAEQTQARDVYAGRISSDLLSERVEPSGADWATVRELNLSTCGVKELTLLDKFPALQHLALDRNLLADVTGLARCVSLVSLDLSFNKVLLSPAPIGRALTGLVNLESASFEGNLLQSIASLQLDLPKLKFLNLRANELQRIDGLDALPNLRELVLDRNKLRAVDNNSFQGTPFLRQLSCDENSIKTLDGLRPLQYLQRVSFASNRIAEITDITRSLENAKQITEAIFIANQAARKQLYRVTLVNALPALTILDGKEVPPEERERAENFFQQETQMALIPPNVLTDVRPVIAPTQGVSGQGIAVPMRPTGLRVMTLDAADGSPSAPGIGPIAPRGGRPVQVGGAPGRGAPRTSSADLSLRPRPKPAMAPMPQPVLRRR